MRVALFAKETTCQFHAFHSPNALFNHCIPGAIHWHCAMPCIGTNHTHSCIDHWREAVVRKNRPRYLRTPFGVRCSKSMGNVSVYSAAQIKCIFQIKTIAIGCTESVMCVCVRVCCTEKADSPVHSSGLHWLFELEMEIVRAGLQQQQQQQQQRQCQRTGAPAQRHSHTHTHSCIVPINSNSCTLISVQTVFSLHSMPLHSPFSSLFTIFLRAHGHTFAHSFCSWQPGSLA